MHLLQVNPAWFNAVALGALVWLGQAQGAGLPALQEPGRTDPVPWTRWSGALVVFDFFAPWCGPCAGTSRELQQGVGDYFRERGGTSRGRTVQVVAINIDDSDSRATAQFLKRAGLQSALSDPAGRLFASWGGKTVPYVVVVDAASATPTNPGRVLARFEGHPGLDRLRQLLEAPDQGVAGATRPSKWQEVVGVHSQGLLELAGEGLVADDIRLYQGTAVWQEKRPVWDLRLQASVNAYDLDYAPASTDFVSRAREVREQQWSVQSRARVRWAERWQAELQGGLYEGFSDYRSLWLDEYYRQYFTGVRGYVDSDPGGWNVSPGLRWEAVPGAAWLQAGVVFQGDAVSPGYEKEPFRPLVRGTEHLDTTAGTLGLETVLSRRWRAQHSLRITDTTNRDLRYEYSLMLHGALAEHWVLRGLGGVTLEPPDFESYQGQVAFERDWNNRWFCGVAVRYYTDNGLVRDPQILSSASPPLDSWQLAFVLRHESERWQAKIQAGPYWTRYEPVSTLSRHFATLYSDRDWAFVQASLAFKF